ncbi:hypothetical protein [Streptomyces decoyicus]|uniref:hypothetical protein n=1 Tax=Streptomyces decoyicus TaxID=249567 RepID=UPI003824295C
MLPGRRSSWRRFSSAPARLTGDLRPGQCADHGTEDVGEFDADQQAAVTSAIDDFALAWKKRQAAATHAILTAFPPLNRSKTPAYCCDITLNYRQEEIGEGRVCIDVFCRATIAFGDLPQDAVAEAIEASFGIMWFDGPDGVSLPLSGAGPGVYTYDDETTCTDYEIVFDDHGRAALSFTDIPVPDTATILHTLTTALSREDVPDD